MNPILLEILENAIDKLGDKVKENLILQSIAGVVKESLISIEINDGVGNGRLGLLITEFEAMERNARLNADRDGTLSQLSWQIADTLASLVK